jgi:hypothetical protein
MIERLFRGDKVMEKPYYKKITPVIDWQWMLVLGVVIGSFLSSQLSGRFQLQWVPEKWAETFYPKLQKPVLAKVDFGTTTLPQLLKVNPWVVVVPAAILLAASLVWMETAGL